MKVVYYCPDCGKKIPAGITNCPHCEYELDWCYIAEECAGVECDPEWEKTSDVLRTGYCPICDRQKMLYLDREQGYCPTCKHHMVWRPVEKARKNELV